MKDLSSDGFETIQKPPNDFEASEKIAILLAKFHASSFFLHDEQKLDFKDFNKSLFDDPVTLNVMYTENLDSFIDVIKEKGGEWEKFIPHLDKLRQTYVEKCLKTYTPNETGYNVLNHGDFHNKNILFKFDADGKVENLCFVSFDSVF